MLSIKDKELFFVEKVGQAVPEEGEIVNLTTVIAKIGESTGHLQKVSGVVTKVCRKKGCWMILTDEGSHARITFKHYAEDAGKSGKGIKGPVKEYSIVASGVYLDR